MYDAEHNEKKWWLQYCMRKTGKFLTVTWISALCVSLNNKNKILKGSISITGQNSFEENVLISVNAAEIPPHVEEGFGMSPASYG